MKGIPAVSLIQDVVEYVKAMLLSLKTKTKCAYSNSTVAGTLQTVVKTRVEALPSDETAANRHFQQA